MTAADEKMYRISESELEEWEAGKLCWNEEKDLHAAIRARGPVEQQAPNCITCHKHSDGYILGKMDVRIIQCSSCIFDERRECIYHGYPDETIPDSCEYKIGKLATIAPIEAQMHNREHDAEVAAQARENVLNALCDLAWCDPFTDNGVESMNRFGSWIRSLRSEVKK